VPVGGSLTLVNADLMKHNVVADGAYGSDDQPWCTNYEDGVCPLFWSALIGTGATTQVLGLGEIEAGRTYEFYCTIHPSMKGTLVALPGLE
jgi:plastocyanin